MLVKSLFITTNKWVLEPDKLKLNPIRPHTRLVTYGNRASKTIALLMCKTPPRYIYSTSVIVLRKKIILTTVFYPLPNFGWRGIVITSAIHLSIQILSGPILRNYA